MIKIVDIKMKKIDLKNSEIINIFMEGSWGTLVWSVMQLSGPNLQMWVESESE